MLYQTYFSVKIVLGTRRVKWTIGNFCTNIDSITITKGKTIINKPKCAKGQEKPASQSCPFCYNIECGLIIIV